MAEDTVKNMVVGFALTLLIAWIALTFLTGGANEYGVSTAEIDGGHKINFTAINSTLEGTNSTMTNLKNTFFSWKILALPITFLVQIYNFIVTPFQLIGNMAHNVLGIPTLVITIVWALLMFVFLLGLWSLFKKGD